MKAGEPCWIEYKRCVYKGRVQEGYIVEYSEREGEVVTKTVPYEPLPDFAWPEGEWFNIGTEDRPKYGQARRATVWERDGQLIPHVELALPQDVFKGYDIVRLDALPAPINSPFVDDETIAEALSAIDDEAEPVEREIAKLQAQLGEINAKRWPWQKQCAHEYEKGEEEEVGNGLLGKGYRRRCECPKCGHVVWDSYTKLG